MAKEFGFSREQQETIDYPIGDILVSAAAGSGKSTVLVQRIIDHIILKNMSINRMLIATFTNNAASSLKGKINDAIIKELGKPDLTEETRAHLTKELSRLSAADISTLDSFFQKIVKSYFFVININPNFSIIDEAEADLIFTKVLDDIFDEEYDAKNSDFYKFVDCYGTSKSDANARKIIKEIVDKACSYPWPEDYISGLKEFYNIDTEDINLIPYFKEKIEAFRQNASNLRNKLYAAIEDVLEDANYAPVIACVNSDLELYDRALMAQTYDEIHDLDLTFQRFTSAKKNMDLDIIADIKSVRDHSKDAFTKSIGFFAATEEERVEELKYFKEICKVIARLAKDAYERVLDEKKAKNTFEFSDIPRFCVDILCEKDNQNNIKPSQYALEIRNKYDEIMIDEYQDSNKIQELILSTISGRDAGHNNIFMVGDVKQSIYRFRQAEPGIFTDKYDKYLANTNPKEKLLPLKNNYRCTEFVIDTVNKIFSNIMIPKLGDIDYTDENHVLNHGVDYHEFERSDDSKTDFIIYSTDEGVNVAEAGAAIIAKKIKDLLDSDFKVYDNSGNARPIMPGDICVLYNSIKRDQAKLLSNILTDHNIPSFRNSKTGYYESIEIIHVLNLLRILDNPYRDIELASILRSYMCGLSNEELALINIAVNIYEKSKVLIYSADEEANSNKGAKLYYYDVIQTYLELSEANDIITSKINRFFDIYNDIKRFSYTHKLRDVIQKIYDETNYMEYCMSRPCGMQKAMNLEMLLNIAGSFEGESFIGIRRFIEYIDNLIKHESDTGEAFLGENINAVQIMTYHASKGLEFPVVILGETHKNLFAISGSRPLVNFSGDNIFSLKYVNPEKFVSRNSFIHDKVMEEEKIAELAEDIRVFYVALTRAKHKLILLGHAAKINKLDDTINKYYKDKKEILVNTYDHLINHTSSYLDMIAPIFLDEEYPYIDTIILNFDPEEYKDYFVGDLNEEIIDNIEPNMDEGDLLDIIEDKEAEKKSVLNLLEVNELFDSISSYLDYSYGYLLSDAPIKYSVSELKHDHMDELEAENAGLQMKGSSDVTEEDKYEPYIPDFEGNTLPVANKGAIRGTLYHLLMEHIIMTDICEYDDICLYIKQKIDDKLFSEDMLKLVKIKDIERFLKSDLAKRMRKARDCGQLFVEQAFVLAIKAKEVYQKFKTDDIILVQGEIDAFFIEDGKAVIIDYKTDKIREGKTAEDLAEYYSTQIEYYEKAVTSIKGVPAKEKLLYSFTLGREIYY